MDQIGNYRIVQKLGEGGMGEVFKGVDMMLEREVAIKVLRPELSQREDVLQRFRSEAIALGRLNHVNIATVFSFARDGSLYYMALEFVNGEGLDKLIAKRGRIAWPDAVRYACAALAGLEHAHRLNVIHRDVKPANILVAYNGAVKLMDFGIARILERARQTRQGYLVGTLEYMSPEQIKGMEVDARSDIYALGMVLYEMLAGRLPFQKTTEYDLLKSQIEEMPTPVRTFAPEIPPSLESIVMRALAKRPEERFGSAQAFLDALSSLVNGGVAGGPLLRETRLAASLPGAGGSGANPWRIRFGELLVNYPVPALSLLALLLGLIGFYYLSASRQPEGLSSAQRHEVRIEDSMKPPPAIVHEPVEEDQHERIPQPQNSGISKTEAAAPAITVPKLENPVLAPVEPPIPVITPIELTPTPTDAIREEKKPQANTRKPSSPVATAKPRLPPDKKRQKKQPLQREEPDENADYWKSLSRNIPETNRVDSRPKPISPTRRKDENADYWRNVERENLKGWKDQ